jgi:hypothetical protein
MAKLLLIIFAGGALLNFLSPAQPQLSIDQSPPPFHSVALDAQP